MILKDICSFLTKLMVTLKTEILPLELFLHELKRVGYLTNGVSFQNYNPLFKSLKVFNTEIYHMESSGFCYFVKAKNSLNPEQPKQFLVTRIHDFLSLQLKMD
jgi:hypothetical protein